jgi:peptidoglycan/xylan/chitin deacetylase (PgdA/CDA1 family)
VPIRGGSDAGQQLLREMAARGHLIGIHTGSTEDHVDHRTRARAPAYDWNRDGVLDERDGDNALESDMRRAAARIAKLTGREPVLVRPTYGATNEAVRAVYAKLGLRMLLWHVDSRDALDHARGSAVIEANLQREIHEQIRVGHRTIIVLFHDINVLTQAHLDDYLIAIYEAVEAEGEFATFPITTDELNAWIADALGLNHDAMGSKPYEMTPGSNQ